MFAGRPQVFARARVFPSEVRTLNDHGWAEPRRGSQPAEDPKAELAQLHARLAELAETYASAEELWAVVERIRDLRARP